MTDHYQTLGVDKNAQQDEIKLAYRKLANQHHPDKGGSQEKFKDISAAYDILGDPTKRAEYDNKQLYGNSNNPYQAHHHFHDIFGGNPFDMFRHQQPHQVRRNRDLNMNCEVSFIDSYTGKQLEAKYTLPSGKHQSIVINVPAGVEHGDTIQYQGLGDDSLPGMPRGSLNVTINVTPDSNYIRKGNNVYTNIEISPIEAMIGCKKQVKMLSGLVVSLDIRAGVETGVEFAKQGGGFTNVHTGQAGDFISIVKIKTPIIKNIDLINKLILLNNEINNI